MRIVLFLIAFCLCLMASGCESGGERSNTTENLRVALHEGMNPEPQNAQASTLPRQALRLAPLREVRNADGIAGESPSSDVNGLTDQGTVASGGKTRIPRSKAVVSQSKQDENTARRHQVEEDQRTTSNACPSMCEELIPMSNHMKDSAQSVEDSPFAGQNKNRQSHTRGAVSDPKQADDNAFSQHLVYGIDLRQPRSERDQRNNRAVKNEQTQTLRVRAQGMIESLKKQAGPLILFATILLLLVVDFVAVRQTYKRQAVFFGSGSDIFWFCLPLLVASLAYVWPWSEAEISAPDTKHVCIGDLLIVASLIFLFGGGTGVNS